MALTVVKTTALSGTITNAQLAGSIDLTSKVTGTLPTGNGGTGATSFSPGKIVQLQYTNNTTYIARLCRSADS